MRILDLTKAPKTFFIKLVEKAFRVLLLSENWFNIGVIWVK